MEAATTIDYKALYEDQKLVIAAMRHEIDQLRKMIFGSRHERFETASHQSQLTLGLAVDAIANVTTESIAVTTTKTISKAIPVPVAHPGRSPLPAHLRREETILEPVVIPEGSKKIGEEITEELEYEPGELYVKKYIRPKYALAATQEGDVSVVIAPMPVRPVDKAIAGPGLLAQIIIDKYVDHLPLYRQQQRFARGGVNLSDSTISGWVSAVCNLLMPLHQALKHQIMNSGYIHADETYIKVLDNNKKGAAHRGYFWVYNNSPGRIVLFDYQDGRSAEAPKELLNNFRGYLQTDGYTVYEDYENKEGVTLLHCMAHARRKFIEAQNNDAVRAAYALEHIQQLYAIERDCKEKNCTDEQRQAIRQQRAMPILEHLGKWMKGQYVQVLPKSPIGQALAYSIQRWDKLGTYTTNGMLCIDNNPVENSIRPVAIGRKNYLFAGSHEAAKRSAMLYSLVGTCKMNNVDPFIWLRDVLNIIPSYPINKIKDLLPHNFSLQQN